MGQDLEEIASILLLKEIKGLGPVRFKVVFERFGSFSRFASLLLKSLESALYRSSVREILGKKVWSAFVKDSKLERIKETDYRRIAENQLILAKQANGRLITYFDKIYPRKLYSTNQAVPIIYASGNIDLLNTKSCSVVGTRRPSGWTVAETQGLVKKLVEDGYTIVSGLAKGIDALAHRTALDSEGNTIAVMGCGPNVYYPEENRILQDRISDFGLIVSEYPFGTKVTGLSLKKRNKIIVGLSDSVYITETSIKGGTMNSYLAAAEQRKPVYVFLPISDVGGKFDGNLRIYNEKRTDVTRYLTGNEPNLERLKNIRALLLDLDGTLWNSTGAIESTIQTILNERNVKFDDKELRQRINSLRSPNKVLKSYGISDVSVFWKKYREKYDKISLYSKETPEILSKLVHSGIKIGVVTALKGTIADELLRYFRLDYLASTRVTPSETRARKPSPTPIFKAIDTLKVCSKEAIYLGDSDADILAAKRAGCFSALAGWNPLIKISERPDYVFAATEHLLLLAGDKSVLRI